MAGTVKSVIEAFDHLYSALIDKEFSKSLYLDEWNERDLAPLVRTFLLGWFGRAYVSPEAAARLPGTISGAGRIDFVVSGVAVELAVRCKGGLKSNLSHTVNASEIKKLMKFDGPGVLVLFDFSRDPLSPQAIERFKEWPSLGRGAHKKSPFQVSYHFRSSDGSADCISRRIRVS